MIVIYSYQAHSNKMCCVQRNFKWNFADENAQNTPLPSHYRTMTPLFYASKHVHPQLPQDPT